MISPKFFPMVVAFVILASSTVYGAIERSQRDRDWAEFLEVFAVAAQDVTPTNTVAPEPTATPSSSPDPTSIPPTPTPIPTEPPAAEVVNPTAFLFVDGVEGESTDDKHKDWIEILSYSFGVSNNARMGFGGGGGAGRATFTGITINFKLNKASPLLFQHVASGKHIKNAVIAVQKKGDDKKQDYLIIKLNDVLVSSYNTNLGSGDSIPTDQISLNYGKIEIEYRPQKPDGSFDSPVKAGWDLKANKKI